jgi:hypothetical protein
MFQQHLLKHGAIVRWMSWQAQHVLVAWFPGKHSWFCMLAVQAPGKRGKHVLQQPSLLKAMVLYFQPPNRLCSYYNSCCCGVLCDIGCNNRRRMRADCLIRVRWQQRMLSSEVKENTSPTESEVSWHIIQYMGSVTACHVMSSSYRHVALKQCLNVRSAIVAFAAAT